MGFTVTGKNKPDLSSMGWPRSERCGGSNVGAESCSPWHASSSPGVPGAVGFVTPWIPALNLMAAFGWWCNSMDWNGIFSSEIFQWKLIFITLLNIFTIHPTLSLCIYCELHQSSTKTTNNLFQVLHSLYLAQHCRFSSLIPNKIDKLLNCLFPSWERLNLPWPYHSLFLEFLFFKKSPLTKQDFPGGSRGQPGRKMFSNSRKQNQLSPK